MAIIGHQLSVSNCFEEIAITEESLDEYEGKY